LSDLYLGSRRIDRHAQIRKELFDSGLIDVIQVDDRTALIDEARRTVLFGCCGLPILASTEHTVADLTNQIRVLMLE
jgi:hypothetical protein